jgi:hypothetical protein
MIWYQRQLNVLEGVTTVCSIHGDNTLVRECQIFCEESDQVLGHGILNHRYLKEVDCSRHISLQKSYFNKTRALVVGTNKTGQQGRWANKAGKLTSQAGLVNRLCREL